MSSVFVIEGDAFTSDPTCARCLELEMLHGHGPGWRDEVSQENKKQRKQKASAGEGHAVLKDLRESVSEKRLPERK